MKIVALSGKKQAGKSTAANFFHGAIFKERGVINDFSITEKGELTVQTVNSNGETGWGVLDVTRNDVDFVNSARETIWPFVKSYSFADSLKWLCEDLFEIPRKNVWGTNEDKDQPIEHLLWENMPGVTTVKRKGPMPRGLVYHDKGPMTAREFMQFFGTDVMRKIYGPIWINNTLKRIKQEQSEFAIISDARFVNEVENLLKEDAIIIRLTRSSHKDVHDSELQLDENKFDYSKFDYVIRNEAKKYSILDLCLELEKVYSDIRG